MHRLIRLRLFRKTSISQAQTFSLHNFILYSASSLLMSLTRSRVKKLYRFFRLRRLLNSIVIKHLTLEVMIAETGLILS